MKYQPIIGLEVHVELNTKSKMFCRCSADYFGKPPNTHTCPVCLGLPGALPFTNEKAIKDCLKIGLALNCTVQEIGRFERKNYFYPDLPKGYQISQYRWPLCVQGWMEVAGVNGKRRIRINRVHQEEDTAKLMHQLGNQNSKIKDQNFSMIDFNRSGVPLVEIVTEPDFRDTSEVRDYTKKIQQVVRYLGVSNADMEKGDMRLEANISLREVRSWELGVGSKDIELPDYRIELKNINSFKFMAAAIEYEIKRQAEALDKGEKLTQETRGWDEDKKETFLQRSKEEAHDYRYFSEPDLPELRVKSQESRVKEGMVELPSVKQNRFIEKYGISGNNAQILTGDKALAGYFEEAVELGGEGGIEPKQIANFLVNQKVDISQFTPSQIISSIQSKKSGVIDDEEELKKLAQEVVIENPGMVDQYQKGKLTVLQALIGGVMRKTSGKANPVKAGEILEKLLEN